MASIGVVLTVFRRPHTFLRQLQAVRAQTVPPSAVVVWHNSSPDGDLPDFQDCAVVSARPNLGVWPRFYLALGLNTDYVCVFDDDTIPGCQWFANCLQTLEQTTALLGTNGVIFPNGDRTERQYIGWKNPNVRPRKVDIVGHSWFLRRQWLLEFAAEPRPIDYDTCGEDYHLSYSLQKRLNIPTVVPPHPPSNRAVWGSTAGDLGRDQVALWTNPEEEHKKQHTHQSYRSLGWRLLGR